MGQADTWANPELHGTVVMLRGVVARDSDAMWEMARDPVGADLTGTTATFTKAQIDEWCATRPEQDQRLDLAIIELSDGRFAGEAVVNEFRAEEQSANFRISLRGPAWFGRGLGTEAIRLVIDHAFGELGLRELRLDVLERNPRARRVYEKSGFQVSGSYAEDGENWLTMELHSESAS